MNDPAFPRQGVYFKESVGGIGAHVEQTGLTKRELFAAMAMQGFLAGEQPQTNAFLGNPNGRSLDVWVAQASTDYADALLAALENQS